MIYIFQNLKFTQLNFSTLIFPLSAISNLALVPVIRINNIADEEKIKKTDQSQFTNTRNYMETPNREKPWNHIKSTIIREITGEKKRILTSALYNDPQ